MMESEVNSGVMALAPEKPEIGAAVRAEAQPSQPHRQPICLTDLPPPGITRWVIRRKAQVVAAVESGAITLEEVCTRYSVSVEEFQSWQNSLKRHGLYGLRTTRAQIYRAIPNPAKGEGSGRS